MTLLNADLTTFKADEGFTPIPPGEYHVRVIDSAVVQTKTGKQMLKVTFEVLGPTHAGRKLFDNFLLGHEVAMSRLKSLATHGGHRNPNFIQNTEELHGLALIVRTKIEQEAGYDPKAVVTSFKPLNQPAPAISAPPPIGFVPPAPAPVPPQPAQPTLNPATPSSSPSAPRMPWG